MERMRYQHYGFCETCNRQACQSWYNRQSLLIHRPRRCGHKVQDKMQDPQGEGHGPPPDWDNRA